MKKIIALAILIFVIVGCASKAPDNAFYAKPFVKMTLPPSTISESIEIQQLLTTTMQKRSMTFMAIFKANEKGMSLIALTPVGIKLFQINYDPTGIQVEKFMPLDNLPKASQILADIMFANFPTALWDDHLPQGWVLHDVGNYRELKDHQGKVVMMIRYEEKNGMRLPIHIAHKVFNYEISFTNIVE